MEKQNIYQDISARTGGEIYLGVVDRSEAANQLLLSDLWNCSYFLQ